MKRICGAAIHSDARALDGEDLLYAGSQSISQAGCIVDIRLGLLKEWEGNQSFEALLLYDHFGLTDSVSFLDQFWDPGLQSVQTRPRNELNPSRNDTWGLHLTYVRPLTATGWRIGWLATVNRISHPDIPNYQVALTPTIVWPTVPWDPGHSQAQNFGVGISKTEGPARFGFDAIFEPIWTYTWAEAQSPTATAAGDTIPLGGKTVENHFRFANWQFRMGVSRDLPVGRLGKTVGLQLGVTVHATNYRLSQYDDVQATSRIQLENWVEYGPTWGLTLHFPEFDLRYQGRAMNGAGRPGVDSNSGRGVDLLPLAGTPTVSGSDIVAAPTGPLTLSPVTTFAHQISLSLPIK